MRRILPVAAVLAMACGSPEAERLRDTTVPTYDGSTGRLIELTFDSDGNGVIDTWTTMDGKRPIMARMDRNEDGRIDRWEYYDAEGRLLKVGYSRDDSGKADAWAFEGPAGRIQRVEISSAFDPDRIDRWEFYREGELSRVEEDTTGDGRVNKWEVYRAGAIASVALDESGDGRPDRRLTYDGDRLLSIETDPDGAGHYTRRVLVDAGR